MKDYKFVKDASVFVNCGNGIGYTDFFSAGREIRIFSKMSDMFDNSIEYWKTLSGDDLTVTKDVQESLQEVSGVSV